ncbi:MAG TPA: TonB-dependent receptor [Flavobacterium sp.]|jgi:iron complex outermembrane receptor protein
MCKTLLPLIAFFISVITYSQESASKEIWENQIENDTVKNKKGEVLHEVIVTSGQQKTPVTAGKAGIAPMDLPQASAVVNHATLETQQVLTMSDVLKNANGVYIMGTTGGYQEEIASRGSALASSNTFKNGVRYFNGMATELSGIEKVEFLKGSAAILFGNVAAGGILNLVTKKPRFDFGGEVSLRYGSFNTIKPTFDIYGGLDKDKKIAFRLNGSYEKADSYRKEVSSERYYFNPSLLVKFSEKTQLLLEGDYLNDTRTPDFGAGIINYEVVDIPRDRFLGVSWGYFDAVQTSATATLTHQLSDNWNVSFINALRYYKTDLFANARPNASGGTIGSGEANYGVWRRNLQRSEVKDNYFLQQLDLKGTFNTWKIGHQFLAGIDSENYKTLTTAYYGLSAANPNTLGQPYYDEINIFDEYDPSDELPAPALKKNTLTTTPVKRFGIYVQDLMSFTSYLKLLAGVRYTYQDTESKVYKYATGTAAASTTVTNYYDDAFSPRIGLIIQPTANHSIFGTYSNSFQVNTGVDITGNALKPSVIDQYEAGVKNRLFQDRLYLNVTAYQITNSNLAQISLANGNTDANVKELAGKTRSQGVEIDITSNPWKGVSIIAGYSFNETKYVESNTYIEGSQLRYNPKHTANLSANYKSETGTMKGFNIGAISTYFGDRYAGRSTTEANPNYRLIPLEAYFLLDAVAGYTTKHFAIRGKVANIFDELNYNIHDDNSLNPIAPINYSISIHYLF